MRRLLRIALILLFFPPLLSIVLGWLVAPSFLRPMRRPLTPDLIQQADASFAQIGVQREALDVRPADGVLLRGWKVRAARPNGAWVLLFHGVADNRMGVLEHALILLNAGYGVTLMDARSRRKRRAYRYLRVARTQRYPRHPECADCFRASSSHLRAGRIDGRGNRFAGRRRRSAH